MLISEEHAFQVGEWYSDRLIALPLFNKALLLLKAPFVHLPVIKGFDAPLTKQELASKRFVLGQAILHSRQSNISKLTFPLKVLKIQKAFKKRDVAMGQFFNVDIGINNDPLGQLSQSANFSELISIRHKELNALFTSKVPSSNFPNLPKQAHVQYVSGMPFEKRSSGYGVRTGLICRTLKKDLKELSVLYSRIDLHQTYGNTDELGDEGNHVRVGLGARGELMPLIENYINQLVAKFSSTKTDLVIAGSNWLNGYCALQAARKCNLPFIYDMRGLWPMTRTYAQPEYSNTFAYKLQMDMEWRVANEADYVFAISDALKKKLVKNNVAPEKICCIPNFVEPLIDTFIPKPRAEVLQFYGLDETAYVLGFAGSIVAYERLDIIIRAMREIREPLSQSYGPLYFVIFGKGVNIDRLKRLSNELGLRDRVLFLGYLEKPDLYDFLCAADAMVFPRDHHKVFQIVPALKTLEPMLVGTPCLLSNIAPHQKLAGKDNLRAICVKDYNPKTWATFIQELVETPPKRIAHMTDKAKTWVSTNRGPKNCREAWGYANAHLNSVLEAARDQ